MLKEIGQPDNDFVFRKLRETAMNNIQRDTGFFKSSGKPVIFKGANTLTKMPHNKLLNQMSKLSEVGFLISFFINISSELSFHD